MNNFNEPNNFQDRKKEEQDKFNKRFLVKLIIFMFFYRFYIMHIDKKGILINFVDNFLTDFFRPNNYELEWADYTDYGSGYIIDDLD